jgi:hypothetical protein
MKRQRVMVLMWPKSTILDGPHDAFLGLSAGASGSPVFPDYNPPD